jgi:hypothetical protein
MEPLRLPRNAHQSADRIAGRLREPRRASHLVLTLQPPSPLPSLNAVRSLASVIAIGGMAALRGGVRAFAQAHSGGELRAAADAIAAAIVASRSDLTEADGAGVAARVVDTGVSAAPAAAGRCAVLVRSLPPIMDALTGGRAGEGAGGLREHRVICGACTATRLIGSSSAARSLSLPALRRQPALPQHSPPSVGSSVNSSATARPP